MKAKSGQERVMQGALWTAGVDSQVGGRARKTKTQRALGHNGGEEAAMAERQGSNLGQAEVRSSIQRCPQASGA